MEWMSVPAASSECRKRSHECFRICREHTCQNCHCNHYQHQYHTMVHCIHSWQLHMAWRERRVNEISFDDPKFNEFLLHEMPRKLVQKNNKWKWSIDILWKISTLCGQLLNEPGNQYYRRNMNSDITHVYKMAAVIAIYGKPYRILGKEAAIHRKCGKATLKWNFVAGWFPRIRVAWSGGELSKIPRFT